MVAAMEEVRDLGSGVVRRVLFAIYSLLEMMRCDQTSGDEGCQKLLHQSLQKQRETFVNYM